MATPRIKFTELNASVHLFVLLQISLHLLPVQVSQLTIVSAELFFSGHLALPVIDAAKIMGKPPYKTMQIDQGDVLRLYIAHFHVSFPINIPDGFERALE